MKTKILIVGFLLFFRLGFGQQWSEWKSFSGMDCNFNVEYRVKMVELFDLNYQVHMYFQVRNDNNKTISYTVALLDGNGKTHFEDWHQTNPSEITEFVHKMNGKYIKSLRFNNAVFTSTKQPICR
jgi:hypothetical protein